MRYVLVTWGRAHAGTTLALLFLLVCLPLIKTYPLSWNDMSRVAAVESLVERSTWAIGGSGWAEQTGDKILLDGRYYSDKMPLLTLLGAGLYAVLHYGLGASLAPNCGQVGTFCAYYPLTLVFVTAPAAGLLWLFHRYARENGAPAWAAVLATAALAYGTMLLPYSLVFNHHLPAAVCLFAGLYLLRARTKSRSASFGAGLLAALAPALDPPAGILALILFLLALARLRRGAGYFAAGAALPILATVALDYQIGRTILPPYMITQGYVFPGSEFAPGVAGNRASADTPGYAFDMLVGSRGLFVYNPVLLFALVGLLAVLSSRRHPLWAEGLGVASGSAALVVYLAASTANFGGKAYGERWLLHALPLLFAFIVFSSPFAGARWRRVGLIAFAAVLIISAISSFQGALRPWGVPIPPLFSLTWKWQFPFLGFVWN